MSSSRHLQIAGVNNLRDEPGAPSRATFVVLFSCLLLLAGCVSRHAGATSAPVLSVANIKGEMIDPLQIAKEQPIVLIFVRTDCPVSNRYAPEIERLYRAYAPKRILFWLVYPDADTKAAEIKEHLREFGLDVPAVRDPKHALVRATGVRVTPEAAVLVPASKLVYRGRIDDRMADFGKERPQAREHDLEQVLQGIASGTTGAPRTTKAIGCYISER